MPYVANHRESCRDQNRYKVIRLVLVIEDRRGVILNNSDRGEDISVSCENCNAPAEWERRS